MNQVNAGIIAILVTFFGSEFMLDWLMKNEADFQTKAWFVVLIASLYHVIANSWFKNKDHESKK